MKVREARYTDIEQLARLFDAYRVFYQKDSDIEAAKSFIGERIKNRDSEIYVCKITDGQIVGFTQLYPLFSSTKMKKLWLLNDLFVSPEFRRQDIAIKLIDRAKKLVNDTEACAMFLETGKSNLIGNNLYPKTGFTLNESSNFYEWSVKRK